MFLRQRLTNLSLTTNRPLQILKTTLLTVATLIFLLSGESAEARYAAFVIDVESGRVLHETNADTRNHPASLTKMMTLYMLFEALKDGRLGGMGIDVYEEEGDCFFRDLSDVVLQDDVLARLLTFPNVLVTAHQAFFTQEAVDTIAETTIGNIAAFRDSGPRGIPAENLVQLERHVAVR